MKFQSIVLAALVASAAPLSAADDINDLTAGLADFTENALPALPMAASAGLDWSNAYVGPLLGGDFPYIHGGAGVSLGITTIPGKAVNKLFGATGGEEISALPLPYVVANLRLGGIILPFDFGLKAGFLPEEYANKVAEGYRFRYQNLGFDVRYDLVKGDFWLPDISAGGGIHYLQIGVAKDAGANEIFTDGSKLLYVDNPKLNLEMRTTVIEAKAQISKTIFFLITPYAGISALLGSGAAESGIEANVSTNASDLSYWHQYQIYANANGFQQTKESATFGLKAYGGFSLNVLILKLDLQGMYNLTDGSGGGQLGVRLEL